MLNLNLLCRKETKILKARTEAWSHISKVAVQLPHARSEADALECKAELPTGVMTFECFSGKIPGSITVGWHNGATWESTSHCPDCSLLQPPTVPPAAWRKRKNSIKAPKPVLFYLYFWIPNPTASGAKSLSNNNEVLWPSWKQGCNCFKRYGFSWQN